MLKNLTFCFTLQADSCTAANIQGIGRPPEPAPPLRRPTIGEETQDSVMARLLAAVVSIGLAAGLIPAGVAAAAQRHSGDHRQWPGPGYAVEDVGPNTPVASAGARPGDRIMAIDGRDVNNSDDIDRAMQRSGHLVVIDVERAGRRLRLKIAPRALTPSEAQEYTVRSRRMLGIVEQRFILRPGTGANDVYIPRLSRRCRQRHLLR